MAAVRSEVPGYALPVIAGVIAGMLPSVPAVVFTPDIVSLVVLPPLLFAAGGVALRRSAVSRYRQL